MPIPGCGDGHGSLVVDHVVCDDGLTATVIHQRGHGYKSRVLDLHHDETVDWLGVVRGGEDAPRLCKAHEVSPDRDRWRYRRDGATIGNFQKRLVLSVGESREL